EREPRGEDVGAPLVVPLRVLPRGTGEDVAAAVAVDVVEAGDGAAEGVAGVEEEVLAGLPPGRGGEGADERARGAAEDVGPAVSPVEEGARAGPLDGCTDEEVATAVAVEVGHPRDGESEVAGVDLVRGGEGVEEVAGGPAEHVRPAGRIRARAVAFQTGADEEVAHPVAVGVGHAGDGVAEDAALFRVGGSEGSEEGAGGPAEYVRPPVVAREGVLLGRPDEEVVCAVAVEVGHPRDGPAEGADLLGVRRIEGVEGGAGGSAEHVRPPGSVDAPSILARRPDEEVAAAVAVDVSEAADGFAEAAAAVPWVRRSEGMEEGAGGPAEHVRPAVVLRGVALRRRADEEVP